MIVGKTAAARRGRPPLFQVLRARASGDSAHGARPYWLIVEMSGDARNKQPKLHPAVMNAKLDAEVWRDPRDRLADAVWVFWHKPYFEEGAENSVRGQNQRMRGYLSRYLDDYDVSSEMSDSHLGRIGLKKGVHGDKA
jgi:hypothetical protein